MRLAQIEGGIVVNVIEVVAGDVPEWAADWPEAVECGPGWTFADGVFAPPLEPPAPVPDSITRFQARSQLHIAGLLDAANAAVAEADPLVQIAWADAQVFNRDSPNIAAIAAALELTEAEVDDLFRAAALITA